MVLRGEQQQVVAHPTGRYGQVQLVAASGETTRKARK